MRLRVLSVRALRAVGLGLVLTANASSASALGVMRITEWMYNGDEFIEFTNVGDAAVDLTDWSFDDDSRAPGSVSFSAFGIVDPGESVILAESSAAAFRAAWGLAASVSVIGSNTVNLGRADELNLFDENDQLVDRLTYGDQTIGGPRTQNLSANILLANLGANRADLAVASFSGDAFESYLSTSAFPGNPGQYAPVPEPAAGALVALGLIGFAAVRRRSRPAALGALALLAPGTASALTLSDYSVSASFALPAAAAEASAVTYNWDTGTLFVLGDEGDALVEMRPDGTHVSTMTLTGFDDTEGVAYVGSGRFAITEERLRDAYLLPYVAGGTAARSGLASADLGATVGNIGIEGISFDRRDGSFVFVKEKTPQEVNLASIVFGAPGTTVASLFTPSLGVLDLSDVSVLSGVLSLTGTPGADDLLIYSQESSRLLHVSRAGAVLGSFDFSAFAADAEGVAIDPDGTIYIVAESGSLGGASTLFVLTAVPEPGTVGLLATGLAGLAALRRRDTAQR